MKRIPYTLLLLFLASFSFASADVNEKASELMKLMEIRKNIDTSMAQVSIYVDQMIDSQELEREVKEAAKAKIKASMAAQVEAMKEMNWESMFGEIYTEVFSEDEIQGLIDFYKSPVGKKMLEKQPELVAATMQRMQTEMAKLMPKIQAATMSAIQDAVEQNQSK
jgi:hypothetical protein